MNYPKMPSTKGFKHNRCVAFIKYDGTNVGVDWTNDRGFHAFRLRTREFDRTDPIFGSSIDAFIAAWEKPLSEIFKSHELFQGATKISVFGEFFGPHTFAGNHLDLPPDEKRQVTIFDIWKEGFGFIGPEDFVDIFGHLPIARVVYRGKFTGQLVEDIRRGKYAGKGVTEGVVVKAGKGGEDIEYAKIKTDAYLERLKKNFGSEWESYWE